MKGIIKLDLTKNYTCSVKGLGEIFEIVSIEIIRKSLIKKYRNGSLYLSSNYDHSKRGKTKEDLENAILQDGLKFISSGYADAPPWKSDPNQEGEKGFAHSEAHIQIAEILFKIWIPLFERFYRTRKNSHVTWAFGIDS